MDRQQISRIAHRHHPVAAPLSDGSVARLLERALPAGDGRLLDLGCGQGAWLLRALSARPGLRAVGPTGLWEAALDVDSPSGVGV
ncbi:SAM-dependent methyltransferase, partial [Kitasatospora sp. NPDC048540]